MKRYAVSALLGLSLLLVGATAAAAQVAPDGNASPDTPASAVLTVNNSLVLLLTGLVIPVVVGLLSRPGLPAWLSVGLNAAVSAVANLFLQSIQDDGTAVLSQEWLLQAALIFGISMASYLGIYSPIARDKGTTVAGATGPGLVGPRHTPPTP